MSFRTRSAHLLVRSSLPLLLAVSTGSFAADLPESLQDTKAGVPASRPSTGVPTAPLPLPALAPVHFNLGTGTFAVAGPLSGRGPIAFAPMFRPEEGAVFRSGGFSVRLMSRMNAEALRYRSTNVSRASGAILHDSPFEVDSVDEATQSAAAARVITRSSHRAMTDELEHVARTSLGLGAALDRLQNVSFHRARPEPSAVEQATTSRPDDSSGAIPAPDRFRSDIGLRLDAHPALMFRARMGAVRGRIDVPVLNEPIRLSLESPVGARGRAVLSSGLPRDGQGWATLTFSFGF